MFGIVFLMVILAGYFQQWLSFWSKKLSTLQQSLASDQGHHTSVASFLNEVGNCMDIENADYTYSV